MDKTIFIQNRKSHQVFKAQKIGEEIPDFMKGATIRRDTTDWSWIIGEHKGYSGQDYWVLGTDNHSIYRGILSKTDKSFPDFVVLDEEGKSAGRLCELNP